MNLINKSPFLYLVFLAKRVFFLACLCVTLAFFPLPCYALTVQNVPHPQQISGRWVVDLAHILSPNTEIQLNQTISKLERENGDEIAVVTVPETSPAVTPKAFTTSLFNYWGIGKSSQNNGVLFLVSVNEHRVEIEVGYGVTNVLSDSLVNNIIQQEIIPQFKQGNYEDGILAGTQSLVMRLSRHPSDTKVLTPENLIPVALFLLLFVAVVAFCVKFILPSNMLSELGREIDNTELLLSRTKFEGCDSGGDGSDSGGGSSGDDGGGGSW